MRRIFRGRETYGGETPSEQARTHRFATEPRRAAIPAAARLLIAPEPARRRGANGGHGQAQVTKLLVRCHVDPVAGLGERDRLGRRLWLADGPGWPCLGAPRPRPGTPRPAPEETVPLASRRADTPRPARRMPAPTLPGQASLPCARYGAPGLSAAAWPANGHGPMSPGPGSAAAGWRPGRAPSL